MSETNLLIPSKFCLSGQLLIAMPNMPDPNFQGAVLYLCEHSNKGAMGLIINRPTRLEVQGLLERVDIDIDDFLPVYPPVMMGGPVASERGFVLHTGPLDWDSTLQVADDVSLTTSRDILEALAVGKAPQKCLIALGYAGWGAGQLEAELAQNTWLTVPATHEILFDIAPEDRFSRAYALLEIDPVLLVSVAGHA